MVLFLPSCPCSFPLFISRQSWQLQPKMLSTSASRSLTWMRVRSRPLICKLLTHPPEMIHHQVHMQQRLANKVTLTHTATSELGQWPLCNVHSIEARQSYRCIYHITSHYIICCVSSLFLVTLFLSLFPFV